MGPTAINGPFMIDMTMFDMMMINQYVPYNNTEIWTLTNNTPISHPFHIHDVQFYILDINGIAPPLNQQGRKDVILVPAGGGIVRFILYKIKLHPSSRQTKRGVQKNELLVFKMKQPKTSLIALLLFD
jgi:FtsP/CotA-like multicopper oxidase with cupredoxin domain